MQIDLEKWRKLIQDQMRLNPLLQLPSGCGFRIWPRGGQNRLLRSCCP
jgi:hypothetical protein